MTKTNNMERSNVFLQQELRFPQCLYKWIKSIQCVRELLVNFDHVTYHLHTHCWITLSKNRSIRVTLDLSITGLTMVIYNLIANQWSFLDCWITRVVNVHLCLLASYRKAISKVYLLQLRFARWSHICNGQNVQVICEGKGHFCSPGMHIIHNLWQIHIRQVDLSEQTKYIPHQISVNVVAWSAHCKLGGWWDNHRGIEKTLNWRCRAIETLKHWSKSLEVSRLSAYMFLKKNTKLI